MVSHSSAAAEQAESTDPGILNAPLFGTLAERMLADGRWVIQDLGPAQAATVDFCNRFRCRLEIADLPTELAVLNEETDPARLAVLAERALPKPVQDPVDVVLCWDLLNYLQRPALTAIMERVAARAHSGCLVHALIVYSATHMPVHPGRYYPWHDQTDEDAHDDQLVYVSATSKQREAPRYTPDDLAHCLRGFRVERAVLLNNGMQEFLFRL